MRKFQLVLVVVLMLTFVSGSLAQTKVRVRFAKGSTSAAIKGRVSGYAYIDYLLEASQGQKMAVRLTSRSPFAQFVVFDRNMDNVEGNAGQAEWSGILPSSGLYTVRVLLPRSEARRRGSAIYTVRISIR
jgi:hypothetical protein